jgi:hypothetical protein
VDFLLYNIIGGTSGTASIFNRGHLYRLDETDYDAGQERSDVVPDEVNHKWYLTTPTP